MTGDVDTMFEIRFGASVMLRIGTIGPVLIVKSPATVAYRYHPGNSIHDILINLIRLDNMLSLERKGEYPGGQKRKKGTNGSNWRPHFMLV